MCDDGLSRQNLLFIFFFLTSFEMCIIIYIDEEKETDISGLYILKKDKVQPKDWLCHSSSV